MIKIYHNDKNTYKKCIFFSCKNWLLGKYRAPVDIGIIGPQYLPTIWSKPFQLGFGRKIVTLDDRPPPEGRKKYRTDTYYYAPKEDGTPNWNHGALRSRPAIDKYCKKSYSNFLNKR